MYASTAFAGWQLQKDPCLCEVTFPNSFASEQTGSGPEEPMVTVDKADDTVSVFAPFFYACGPQS